LKPVINLDEIEMIHDVDGPFESSYGVISKPIGAKHLGYSLSVVPPGKKVCPYHNHQVAEEMFFILSGTGTLRFGDKEYPLRPNDAIACPPGGRDVAHQIINTGTEELRYLCMSTLPYSDVCEYPDSDKVGVFVGDYGKRMMRLLFKADSNVDYMLGETK
jgi:uncharacterized cupin superfamily protein